MIEATVSYTQFATEFAAKHKVDDTFDISPDVMDDFKVFLAERRIQPPIGDWFKDKDRIRTRLKQEIITIALGVSKGDEIDVQLDTGVQRAVARLTQ